MLLSATTSDMRVWALGPPACLLIIIIIIFNNIINLGHEGQGLGQVVALLAQVVRLPSRRRAAPPNVGSRDPQNARLRNPSLIPSVKSLSAEFFSESVKTLDCGIRPGLRKAFRPGPGRPPSARPPPRRKEKKRAFPSNPSNARGLGPPPARAAPKPFVSPCILLFIRRFRACHSGSGPSHCFVYFCYYI